jgi:hypothetical protein
VEGPILEIQELGLKDGKISSRQIQIRRPPGARFVSTHRKPSIIAMMPVMVVPVMVVTPVVMAMPVAIVANPAQAVVSSDHPAAVVRGIIIRVVVIGPVEVPVKAMVPKREPAVAEAAPVENMRGAKSPAMEGGATAVETAAVKRRTSTMEATASAAVKSASPTAMTAATMTTTAATTTMTAADFGL